MFARFICVSVVAGAIAVGFATARQDAKAEKPRRTVRLNQPWTKVADLTEEQKEAILDIRQEIADQIKALQAAEVARCMEVLTPAQREQLEKTLAEEAAAKKAPKAEN